MTSTATFFYTQGTERVILNRSTQNPKKANSVELSSRRGFLGHTAIPAFLSIYNTNGIKLQYKTLLLPYALIFHSARKTRVGRATKRAFFNWSLFPTECVPSRERPSRRDWNISHTTKKALLHTFQRKR